MEEKIYYKNYPFSTLCLSIVVTLLSYAVGIFIFYLINIYWVVGYAILCLVSLFVGMKYRCKFCYYYGKKCASGLGTLARIFFKKGDTSEFKNTKNLIPPAIFDFTALLSPIVAAVVLMIIKLSLLILVLFITYLLLAVLPGFFLRKNIYCEHCKQGELGCPAYEGIKRKEIE